MKKAFTLIELLVVIAIIAILAAILFPVFAQAKAAAKGTAALSNAKQIGTASAIYLSDFDDTFVLSASASLAGAPVQFGTIPVSTWVWLLQPYCKNTDLFVDPTGPSLQSPAGWPRAIIASLNPTFGYNYNHLSPFYVNGGTYPTTQPVSATAPANPSATVMFASKFSTTEWSYSTAGLTGLGFWGSNPNESGPLLNTTVEVPDCYTIPSYCADNWGNGFWTTALLNKKAAGSLTGGASRRVSDGITMVMTDTSASRKRPGAAAAGTNWADQTTFMASSLVVNNKANYIWDIE
jgi:prepilin-type N-terminal cleavage/methylation domain-containing protein